MKPPPLRTSNFQPLTLNIEVKKNTPRQLFLCVPLWPPRLCGETSSSSFLPFFPSKFDVGRSKFDVHQLFLCGLRAIALKSLHSSIQNPQSSPYTKVCFHRPNSIKSLFISSLHHFKVRCLTFNVRCSCPHFMGHDLISSHPKSKTQHTKSLQNQPLVPKTLPLLTDHCSLITKNPPSFCKIFLPPAPERCFFASKPMSPLQNCARDTSRHSA